MGRSGASMEIFLWGAIAKKGSRTAFWVKISNQKRPLTVYFLSRIFLRAGHAQSTPPPSRPTPSATLLRETMGHSLWPSESTSIISYAIFPGSEINVKVIFFLPTVPRMIWYWILWPSPVHQGDGSGRLLSHWHIFTLLYWTALYFNLVNVFRYLPR